MNARTLSIAALGAALCLVVVLYSFRSQEPRTARTDGASLQSGTTDDDSLVTDRADESVSETLARDQVADAALSHDEGISSGQGQHQVQGLLPNQVPRTPMAQALEELQLPPVPELLATEREFASESVDPLWSEDMEGHILREIAQITGLKLVGLQVECRTTMCRLQLVEPEPAKPDSPYPSFNELVATFGLEPRWVMSVLDRYGTPTSLAYLMRAETEVTNEGVSRAANRE